MHLGERRGRGSHFEFGEAAVTRSARYSINAQKSGEVENSEIVCRQKQLLDIKCPW